MRHGQGISRTIPIAALAISLLMRCAMLSAQTTQSEYYPLRSVIYFNNYDATKTSWPLAGDVYSGGGASVQTIRDGNGYALPIESAPDGERAIDLATTMPSGYWNILFKIQQQPVNLTRLMDSSGSLDKIVLRLRLKWGVVLPGDSDDIGITLQDDQNQSGPTLALGSIAQPSTDQWQDIDIPLAKLAGEPASLDLTHVIFIKLSGLHPHAGTSSLLIAGIAFLPGADPASFAEDLIKVDQAGYRTHDAKIALVSFPPGLLAQAPQQFVVQSSDTGNAVYTGALQPASVSQTGFDESGDSIYDADFSAVTTPGSYQIAVQAAVRTPSGAAQTVTTLSAAFRIGDDVYTQEFRDALRFYYYSRSGVPIDPVYGEGYSRDAVHAGSVADPYSYPSGDGNAPYPDGATRDVKGGWLDAGDKSVQTYSHVVAIWHLLNAYKDFGDKVPKGSLHLPESGYGTNDLLTTVLYGLAWLNKMSDQDGGVHVQVNADDTIEDVDTVATAAAAGAYAKAYTVLKTIPAEKASAANCLSRAEASWRWLENHPDPLTASDPNNPGAGYPLTAEYKTRDLHARLFAQVELYDATGDPAYGNAFTAAFDEQGGDPVTAFGGLETGYQSDHVIAYLDQDPLSFAYWDYMSSQQAGADKSVQAVIKAAYLHQADMALKYQAQTGYDFAMLYPGHLYWGSNENVLSAMGIVLIHAYEWTADTRYRDAALDNLHFINGRNPVDRDFISGETDYAHGCDFYSQFWTDLTHQPPGYAGAFINVDKLVPYIKDPWKRYINFQDASSCEPDVYWNCEFASLAGYFATAIH